ncbi:MAG TPA: helix-turn-helix transcriptional regulator [Pirellulales bacterium]|nr:helix-turn-helix transcriptional regulator [Pirellulales bacterium]
MKRIIRQRRLTDEEAANYRTVREQVAAELPDLVARHHERVAALDKIDKLVKQLKSAREQKGLSLADVSERTGMDRSALSKLENGVRPNPTVDTLVRYADAVGLRLEVSLIEL